jgi:hypothetical protein
VQFVICINLASVKRDHTTISSMVIYSFVLILIILCVELMCTLSLSVSGYLMHLVDDEVGDLQVPVNHRVHLKIVVVFPKGIDQRLGHLITNVKGS